MRRRATLASPSFAPGFGAAFVFCLAVGLAAQAAPPAAEPSPDDLKFFEMKVRPLLAENCFSCHGEKKRKGDLRLDSRETILKGGENGPAVVPGKPEASLLVKAVSYKHEDLQMPPDEEDKLSPEQIEVLAAWVKRGAPWPAGAAPAGGAAKSKKRTITDADRGFWSFQPVKSEPVPQVDDRGWAKTPVDKFIFAKLRAQGLDPAPEADRTTLIRRATFDLHGLPPTPAEVEAFVGDASPDAYEKLIDRLLASPRYGERYARHWFDLVRYAESDGYKQDAYRPSAWPFRDYVIRSLNQDKPYDRFVAEQLAGDEMAADEPEVVVATGFLRHGIYEYNQADVRGQWAAILNDVTDVTADAFLGLSMGCARCHDHKFDPILQSDYYQLQAFFTPMLPRNDLPLATPKQKAEYEAALAKWEETTAAVRAEIAAMEEAARKKAIEAGINKFPLDVRAIIYKPAAERTPLEEQLAQLGYRQVTDKLEALTTGFKGKDKQRYDALKARLAEFDSIKPRAPMPALIATDVGAAAPPTTIPGDSARGELQPGYPVVLEGKTLQVPSIAPLSNSTGRRTALAKWVTQPANPLTTRVIANRLWQWHFGRGIVATASDFGTLGERPTHPELLDWLAKRFVDDGWSFKKMHRLIMTSAVYRQAGVRPNGVPQVAKLKDPENRWLWRMNPRRLDAEQIRDAMLMASGELQLDEKAAGGPSVEYTAPRRTVYTKQVRNNRDPLLDAFDLPEMFASSAERNVTTTATQSLLMINGDWPLKRAAAFAQRVTREAASADAGARVDAVYRIGYGRAPMPKDRAAGIAFLSRSHGAVVADGNKPDPAPVPVLASASASPMPDQPITQIMPQTGGLGVLVRDASPGDMLRLPSASADADALFEDEFTVEAFVLLESIYEDASVRVIASRWDGRPDHPGWSLGVTSEKSKHQPRNLILQLAGDAASGAGAGGYEVVASNLRLDLHKTYYVAVSVKLKEESEAGVTFYVKDVGDMDAPLLSVGVRHRVTAPVASKSPLIIGGREPEPRKRVNGWDGLIGELRISRAALGEDELLWNDGAPKHKAAVVGHWKFEETPGLTKDAGGFHRDLVKFDPSQGAASGRPAKAAATAPPVNVDAALLDFCHALFNSNEFLYVD